MSSILDKMFLFILTSVVIAERKRKRENVSK